MEIVVVVVASIALDGVGCSRSVNSQKGSTNSCEGNGRNCSPTEIIVTALVSIVAGAHH